jgi:hypothetical protein
MWWRVIAPPPKARVAAIGKFFIDQISSTFKLLPKMRLFHAAVSM